MRRVLRWEEMTGSPGDTRGGKAVAELPSRLELTDEAGDTLRMAIRGVALAPPEDDYQPVQIRTSRGTVACRYCPVPGATHGAVWVGGVGGGFDTPARDLYPRLCRELTAEHLASLRVRFRHPTILAESVLDVLAGLAFLQSQGVGQAALVGHSFGGAVVIQAAAASDTVRTVVTLATQSYGTEAVGALGPRCSLLLLHGRADRVLPFRCSQDVYERAGEPKRLVLYDRAGHGLDEVAGQVRDEIHTWIVERLIGHNPSC
jgi:pimeloyl-ACP methyl ester carboxylesterase